MVSFMEFHGHGLVLMFPLPSECVHTHETFSTECGSISPQSCTASESRWIRPTSELPCPCPHGTMTALTSPTSPGNGEDGSQGAGESPQVETEGNVARITINKTRWYPGALSGGKWQKTHWTPASSLQITGSVLVLIIHL